MGLHELKRAANMITFELDTPYIELIKLLKATRVAESGAAAKTLVETGQVYRDGQPESRKRAKIVKDEVITVAGKSIRVV
ncbi:MAG: RNA-binding S4 domain-containing protein [Odoribacteraceae bacterium]|jgi:ribosome-associated protein|nr:RNA-binding S4 domain-containing protein [Odoribacteraceae bacterium]